MKQRQGVQQPVIAGDLGVGENAAVLPQHGGMTEHGTLGRRLRATGVNDLCGGTLINCDRP